MKKNSNNATPEFDPQFMFPNPMDDGTKIIESECHTLFVNEEEPELKEFEAIDGDQSFTAIREVVPKHDRYTLYVSEFENEKASFHKILHELRKGEDFDTFDIRISSAGGAIFEGLQICNIMRDTFNSRTTTYIDAHAYSMAAILFIHGDKRIAYEYSEIMFHTYSTMLFGKGGEISASSKFVESKYTKMFETMLMKSNYLTKEELSNMLIGKDIWLDSYEMAKRNICTHVIVEGFVLENSAYIEYHDQSKPIEEWVCDKFSLDDCEIEADVEPKKPTTNNKKPKPNPSV